MRNKLEHGRVIYGLLCIATGRIGIFFAGNVMTAGLHQSPASFKEMAFVIFALGVPLSLVLFLWGICKTGTALAKWAYSWGHVTTLGKGSLESRHAFRTPEVRPDPVSG